MTKRKQYKKEFKLDIVSPVAEQGYTRSEAASSLDVSADILGLWVREQEAGDGQSFRGNGKQTPE